MAVSQAFQGNGPHAPPEARAGANPHPQPLPDGPLGTESSFLLENDPALIPAVVARLHAATAQLGLFDDHTANHVDLALHEALINGMQHGNLELDSGLRQDEGAAYHRLAEWRRRHPPYRDRRLHVRARLSRAEAIYVIRDEGPGFNPAGLPDPTDPAHLARPSGRGLFLIRALMDEVIVNGAGNQITLIKRRTTALDTGRRTAIRPPDRPWPIG